MNGLLMIRFYGRERRFDFVPPCLSTDRKIYGKQFWHCDTVHIDCAIENMKHWNQGKSIIISM